MLKKTVAILYVVVMAVMAIATIVEKYEGTSFVGTHIYGAWWFSLLWALLAAAGIAWMVKQKLHRRPVVALLHLSFVIILLGALLTHLTARQGVVHLRIGDSTGVYLQPDGSQCSLPFSLRLDSFQVVYHEGTRAAADYVSSFTIIDGSKEQSAEVSMNRIANHHGVRLYQSSYDDDMGGTVVAVNSDPWGIPITYTGYFLLFGAFIAVLFDPKGTFRRLLTSPLLKQGVLCLALLPATSVMHAASLPCLPESTAYKFGQLNMLFNDRICPVQTYAIDFTKQLCGKAHYGDYTAEQVLTGFIFWGDEWSREPMIKIKEGKLKSTLQLPDFCSVQTFFNPTLGGYILGPYIQEYYRGQQHDDFHKQAAKIDDKLMLIMQLRQGKPLKLFPYSNGSEVHWLTPTEKLDSTISEARRHYIRQVFSVLNEDAHNGNFSHIDALLDKMLKDQYQHGAASIPTDMQLRAERLYNSVPLATLLFMFCLTLGFILLFAYTWLKSKWVWRGALVLFAGAFLTLTFCIALRWVIKGTVPMSNGYETMLLMAWMIMLLSLLACRRFRIALAFGFLMSGFFLLVSHINQMDPAIGHIMPVLNSPLLALHVSIIMMAFALLSLTFICGVTAIVIHVLKRNAVAQTEALALLSRLLLYPALVFLTFGIFIGAIWANVSWGTYWSWDPKETWALITLMVYAVVVHTQSLPVFRRPMAYHVYVTLAFLTILMTYFGVNYYLGGMHSYA